MAAARGSRQPGRSADHVRRRGRTPARGVRNPWLPGYEGQLRCVWAMLRRGRCSSTSTAKLMDALYVGRRAGLAAEDASWALECALITHLEKIWNQPDDGIWEVRGSRKHFTHSKVMAWVAFDRAVRSAEEFDLEGPLDRWRRFAPPFTKKCAPRLRFGTELFRAVLRRNGARCQPAVDPDGGIFAAVRPRVRGTWRLSRAVDARRARAALSHGKGADGLPPGEGVFLACSFWLADNYVLQGRSRTRDLFERLCHCATTWDCWRRNMTPPPSANWVTFHRRFPTSR